MHDTITKSMAIPIFSRLIIRKTLVGTIRIYIYTDYDNMHDKSYVINHIFLIKDCDKVNLIVIKRICYFMPFSQ